MAEEKYICDYCKEPTNNIYEFDGYLTGRRHVIHECDKCADRADRLEDFKNEQYQMETIVCPWCGYEYEHSECIYEEGEDEIECYDCGREFEVETINVGYVWTTRKPDRFFKEDAQC